ncbi:MAG: hypothetical protein ACTSRS_08400 [Candidatus Helarchaeota archaeon]
MPIGFYTNLSKNTLIDHPNYELPGYKFFDLFIDTFHLNITYTNLTFFDISAQDAIYAIEDYPEYFISNAFAPLSQFWGAMSFKIPTTCKLRQVKLFLQETNLNAQWNLSIYNATRDLSADLEIRPDSFTGISILQNATDINSNVAAHWQNFTFPDVQLNMSNTYVDANGFAYYFIVVLLPIYNPLSSDYVSFWYYEYDEQYIEDGWAYYGVDLTYVEHIPVDYCMKIEVIPLSTTPSPNEVGIAVKNPKSPPLTDLNIESNYSVKVGAAYNLTSRAYLFAQNFTLTEYATIHNISIYLKNYGNATVAVLGIFPNNESGIGPYWDGNYMKDMNYSIFLSETNAGWWNFSMIDIPNLAPGNYWWVLFCQSLGNITVFGASDSSGDDAVLLNITAISSDSNVSISQEEIPFDIATIIYYQPGRDYFPVNQSWIYDSLLTPDLYGYYHFEIISRWYGTTVFTVTSMIEVENNTRTFSYCYVDFTENLVWWNLTFTATFPSSPLGKIINVTIPADWTLINVSKNGILHDMANWTLKDIETLQRLSIYNASDGRWTVWFTSPPYALTYVIEKYTGGQYQPAFNASVYDRIRINATIFNQTNGDCYLTIFYPDGKSRFINHSALIDEQILLSWNPENDSAATGGNYTFVVYWQNGTALGFQRQYFWFTPIPSALTLISSLPIPYVNDTTQTLLVRYNDTRGVNISGATLFATLNGTTLEWEDLYRKTLNPSDLGIYRIKLNTFGLNAGQSYVLNAWAYKAGYENVTLPSQFISIQPVPTLLVTNLENITQYTDESISFSCSFKDTFHGVDIDWASINYTILGAGISGSMTSIMPGESVYIANDVQLTGIIGHSTPYLINITAIAENCAHAYKTINLFVKNKTPTSLTLTLGAGPYIQGQKLRIQAVLHNESSGQGIANATIRFSFGDIILDQLAETDINGIAVIEIIIPSEKFTITATFDATASISHSFDTSGDVSVITYVDISIWIGIIIGICVGSVLAFRQFYLVPKRNRQMKEYRKIATKFQDVASIRQILLLHQPSSTCIYQQSLGEALDGDLISGFLTAISGFQEELKPGKIDFKKKPVGGFELNYQDYKILLFTGKLISLALIVEEPLSQDYRELAQSFLKDYEAKYHDYLIDFRGNLQPFKTSYAFICEKLKLTLLWPHTLNRPMTLDKFSSLHASVIRIADTVMKSQVQNYFFLPLIISIHQAGQPKNKLEAFAAVYQLHKLDIFHPVNPETGE